MDGHGRHHSDAKSACNRPRHRSTNKPQGEIIAMQRPREGWKNYHPCHDDVPHSNTGDTAKVSTNDQRRNKDCEP